jgi:hypothetical protein
MDVLPDMLKRAHVPGTVLALVRGGDIAWVRAFGVARAGDVTPLSPGTRFQAASLGKPVFAQGDRGSIAVMTTESVTSSSSRTCSLR